MIRKLFHAQARKMQRAFNYDTSYMHEIIDISQDPEARDFVMALGYLQAPVVVAGEDHWSGFRPDRIKALTAAVA